MHDFLERRPVRLVAQGAVLTGIVLATVAIADAGSLVSRSLNGQDAQVELADPAGMALSASRPQVADRQITVTADGSTRAVTSSAGTVADLLAEQGITLGRLDRLSVPATAPVVPGMAIDIVRVTTRTVVATEPLAFTTTKTRSRDLAVGTTKVVTKGKPGEQRVTYRFTYADGKQIDRTRVSAEISRKPVTAQVQVGSAPTSDDNDASTTTKSTSTSTKSTSTSTKSSSSSSGSSSTGTKADGLNWAALAKCESGGNPRAVNPAGYYGLYQFSLSTWRSVGGSGNPRDASSAEQTKRAKILYNKAGAGQWPVCGRKLFT